MPAILIVDDVAGIRRMLQLAFSRAGYEVTTAPEADAAIQACLGKHFDVVLSDVDMPRTTGCDLARWVARRHPATQIILMSGHELPCDECPFSPRCTVLRKPFQVSELIHTVDRAIKPV